MGLVWGRGTAVCYWALLGLPSGKAVSSLPGLNIGILTWLYFSGCSRRDIRGPTERLWKGHSKRSTVQGPPAEPRDGESEPDPSPGPGGGGAKVRSTSRAAGMWRSCECPWGWMSHASLEIRTLHFYFGLTRPGSFLISWFLHIRD